MQPNISHGNRDREVAPSKRFCLWETICREENDSSTKALVKRIDYEVKLSSSRPDISAKLYYLVNLTLVSIK